LLERLQAVPGVEVAGFTAPLPMSVSERDASRPVLVERSPLPPSQASAAEVRASAGYFPAMRIPLLRGRTFTEQDSPEEITLISETLARRCWPNQNPVGKRLKFVEQPSESSWVVVVGVVGDVMSGDGLGPALPLIYRPLHQASDRELTVVIRTFSAPGSLASAVKKAVWEVDKEQPLADLQTMQQLLREVRMEYQRMTGLFGAFAGIALALAALGVYSVMSYFVAERIPEIGVRMALGARPADILRLVTRQGLKLALSGGVTGLVGAWVLGRVAFHEIPEIRSSFDLVTFNIALLLAAVALFACYVPARRAAKVDPMVALRYE